MCKISCMKRPHTMKQIKADSRVESVSDERAYNSGYWVYLKPGWINTMTETHCIHEDTVKTCCDYFRYVAPCDCEQCAAARID
jgi:hypothetical protein